MTEEEAKNEGVTEQLHQDEQNDLSDYQLVRDRPRRQTAPPARLNEYEYGYIGYEEEFEVLLCMMVEDRGSEPKSYQ